jgi:hypothetical protein
MTRLVVLLAALLAAAAAVQGSQATFTASKSNSTSSFVTAAKFPPTVTLTAPANGSFTNDTTPLIAGTADTATGDSTTVTAKIYSGTTATGSPVQTKTGTRSGTSYSFSLTTALAQGTYTAVVTQTDTSGNTGTSNANTFTVDTTAPTGGRTSPPPTRRRHRGQDRVGRHADLHLLRGRHAGVGVDRLGRLEHRGPHQVHERRQRHDHDAHHRGTRRRSTSAASRPTPTT